MQVNNFSYTDSIIFEKDGNLNIIKDYKKYRLASDNLLYGTPDKFYILQYLQKYKYLKKTDENLDATIFKIKKITENLTKNTYKNNEKIAKIYDYILEHVSYAENYDFDTPDFFSGIKTYENKSGVCAGYVELFNMMLAFSLIDSEIIIGDVLSADDFGEISHAWVQIGKYFYDPTFDDPIGAKETREPSEYFYYKLPEDLFYTNRFNYEDTPENLKQATAEQRNSLIRKNIAKIYEKYKKDNYNLLKEIQFRKEHNIGILKSLEINDIVKAAENLYESNLQTANVNGKNKNFKQIVYIRLEEDPLFLNSFLISVDYKLEGYTAFKTTKDGETFYIISNNYSFY